MMRTHSVGEQQKKLTRKLGKVFSRAKKKKAGPCQNGLQPGFPGVHEQGHQASQSATGSR
jgi:hypothetical protein